MLPISFAAVVAALLVAIGDDDLRASSSESVRGRPADSTSRTGEHGDASAEIKRHGSRSGIRSHEQHLAENGGVGLFERSVRRGRHRRFQEADHAVDEVGGLQGEREHRTSPGAGALAVRGGLHGQLQGLREPVCEQRFVDAGEARTQLVLVFALPLANRRGRYLNASPPCWEMEATKRM